MRPPLPVEWNGNSTGQLDPAFQANNTGAKISAALLNAYFDGLEKHSSKRVPFAAGCTRRDNFVQANLTCAAQLGGKGTAPNGLTGSTTTVRDRRILVADSDKAVMAVALVDEPADGPGPLSAAARIPGTYLIPQLIKTNNGTISRVESMIKWMPYGYTSAWAEVGETLDLSLRLDLKSKRM